MKPVAYYSNYGNGDDEMEIFNNGQQATDTEYTDRLWQWDSKKHDELCLKHFGDKGQWWSNRSAEKIQAFLCDYIGKKVVLCRVERVKRADGNYIWRLDYKKA